MITKIQDEDFNNAYFAEHGIEQEIDIKKAIELYNNSFNNGNPQAGIFLARLLEKNQDQEQAKRIYQHLTQNYSKKTVPLDTQIQFATIEENIYLYAQYRNLRINESRRFAFDFKLSEIEDTNKYNRLKEVSKKLFIKLEEEYKVLLSKIESLENRNVKENYTKKISYHLGLIKLKLAEYSDFETRKTENNLKLKSKTYLEAIKYLESSAKLGYKKAKAELINLEARTIEKSTRNFNKINKTFDQAIQIDPNNVNAKLIKIDALLAEKTQKEKNKSLAQKLLAEVLKKDPNNPYATKIKKRLTSEMIEKISFYVMEDLKSKIKIENSLFSPWKNRNSAIRKEELLKLMNERLIEALEKDPYISKYARFSDINEIYNQLSFSVLNSSVQFAREYIDKSSMLTFSEEDLKKSEKLKEVIDDKIDNSVSYFSGKKLNERFHLIEDDKLKNFHENREEFKKIIVEKLLEYYNTCITLTTKTTDSPVDIDIKINDVWNQAVGGVAKAGVASLGAFLGPCQSGVLALAAGKVVDGALEALKQDEKNALYQAVIEFSQIGKTEDSSQSAEEEREKAKERFNWLADSIVSEYGMQIDRVSPDSIGQKCGLKELAELTVSKMLNRLHQAHPSFQQMIKKIPQNFVNNILNIGFFVFENVKHKDPTLKTLKDGVFRGQSKSEEKTINLRDSSRTPWKVGEIYSKPALTQDGENVFCNKSSDPDVYGAKIVSIIPSSFKKTDLKPDVFDRIKQEFEQHQELEEVKDSLKSSEKILSSKVIEIEVNQENYAKKKRNARFKRDLHMGSVFLGAMIAYAGAALGTASSLGFSPVALTATAAIIGVSAGFMLPIVVASAVAIGMYAMYKGVSGAIKEANHLEILDRENFKVNKKIINSNELDQNSITQVRMKERAENLARKEKLNLKYVSFGQEKSPLPQKKGSTPKLKTVVNKVMRSK